jgi:hypothetical protein
MKPGRIVVGLVLLALAFAGAQAWRTPRVATPAVSGPIVAKADAPAPRTSAPSGQPLQRQPEVQVAFKLDPAITRAQFLGERWVAPETYAFAQAGDRFVVQARMQAVDARGERTEVPGQWTTDAPGMIALAPGADGRVTLVVRQAGEGGVVATSSAGTKALRVRATKHADAMEVAISQ